MTQAVDYEALAARLTKPMRDALKFANPRPREDGNLWTFARRGTMAALMERGLVDVSPGYPPRVAPLSAIGVEVRERLRARDGEA